jgi:hypothetical protein
MDILMAHEKGNSLGSTKKKQSHKRRGKSFWIKAVNDFEGSPLSLQEFCAERGLAVSTFHGWRRRLSAGKVPNQKTAKAAPKPQPQFLPVYVTSSETPAENPKQADIRLRPQPVSKKHPESSLKHLSGSSSGLSIYLNGGLKINIDRDFHGATLQRLLQLFSSGKLSTC